MLPHRLFLLSLLLHPSSDLLPHISHLRSLLLASPPPSPPPLVSTSSTLLLPNPLLRLDLLDWLLHIAGNLASLLSTISLDISDDASSRLSSSTDDLGLLSQVSAQKSGCLDRFLGCYFRHSSDGQASRPLSSSETVSTREFAKKCGETTVALQRFSQEVGRSSRDLHGQLSSLVRVLSRELFAAHGLPSFVTAAHVRGSLHPFLYAGKDIDGNSEVVRHGNTTEAPDAAKPEWLMKQAEQVIERLVDPRGPIMVGIGGGSGLGKTCLATYVAHDGRIMANFPGGSFYLELGQKPDVRSLQMCLWKRMYQSSSCSSGSAGSPARGGSFYSEEEGIAALTSLAEEGLPILLVLDDVHDASHIAHFLCFDGINKGRIIVIANDVERLVSAGEHEAFIHVLKPLDDGEAIRLFRSIVVSTNIEDPEWAPTVADLVSRCDGVPRLIQAAASVLEFLIGTGLIGAPSSVVGSSLKSSLFADTHPMVTNVSSEASNPCNPLMYLMFDALHEVHPYLPGCLLDLAAFPRGEWIETSVLLDLWRIGDKIGTEKAFLALCLLVGWSFVEWRVEEAGSDDCLDASDPCDAQYWAFQWRLAGEFYDLAQSSVEKRLNESSAVSRPPSVDDRDPCRYGRSRCSMILFNYMNSPTECTFAGLNATRESLIQPDHDHDHTHADPEVECHLCIGDDGASAKMSSSDRRCFIPGWSSDQWPVSGIKAAEVGKLSLISGSTAELSSEVEFPKLRVALLCGNTMMKTISANIFDSMEQLLILDLSKCLSLSAIPDTIGNLASLELLDLSGCVNLDSLPKSIGNLRNLKCLRMSGCLSVTHLPDSLVKLLHLETLDLSLCTRMKMLPKSLGRLSSLQCLNLFGCYSLQHLPASIALLRKLTRLVLSECSNISSPHSLLEQIKVFTDLHEARTTAIPADCWKLGQLEILQLCSLKRLTYLPGSVNKLQHLRHLNLSGCRSLEFLPDDIGSLFLLEKLDLSHTAIRKLPTTISHLSCLMSLCLRGCSRLLSIPSSVCALQRLEMLDMAECWDFVLLPDEFGMREGLPRLHKLDLSGCSIKQLPCFEMHSLQTLQALHLAACEHLLSLPESLGNLTSLEKLDFRGCKSLASLDHIGLSELRNLQWLSLRNCLSLSTLPVSELVSLKSLKFLDVSGCSGLSPFPSPLLQLAKERLFTLVRWGTVWR